MDKIRWTNNIGNDLIKNIKFNAYEYDHDYLKLWNEFSFEKCNLCNLEIEKKDWNYVI
jgi:hypothetical protein